MKRLLSVTVCAVLTSALSTAPARAQESSESSPAPAAASPDPSAAQTGIEFGPGSRAPGSGEEGRAFPGQSLILGLELSGGYTDNFYYEDESGDKQDALGVYLIPSIYYSNSSPRFQFTGSGAATVAMFDLQETADDYRDLFGSFGAIWTVSPRHALGYDIGLAKGHEPFGLNRTASFPVAGHTLDRWNSESYGLHYRYGTLQAPLGIEAKVNSQSKTYRTNRDSPPGFGTRYLDGNVQSGELTFLYHYSPKTHFLLDFIGAQVNSEEDFVGFPTRSNKEYHALTGVRWVATAKTSGDARVGYVTRRFECNSACPGNQYEDFNGFDWQVVVQWKPVSRRKIKLETGRRSLQSFDAASFIDVQHVGLNWSEQWTPRFNTLLKGGYSQADFVSANRNDDGMNASIAAEYLLMRKVTAFAQYAYQFRDSDVGDFEYNSNAAYVGLRAYY